MSDSLQDFQVGGTHYTDMDVQPWDCIRAVLTHEEWVGYLKGNAIKYAMRAGHKEGTDDKAKFAHYSAKLLCEENNCRDSLEKRNAVSCKEIG